VTLSFDCGQLAVGHPWRKLHAYSNPQRTLGADPSRPSRKPQGKAWGSVFQVEVVPPVPLANACGQLEIIHEFSQKRILIACGD